MVVLAMIVSSSLAFGGVFPVSRMVLFALGGLLAVLWVAGVLWGDTAPMKLSLGAVVYLAIGALAVLQLLLGPIESAPAHSFSSCL